MIFDFANIWLSARHCLFKSNGTNEKLQYDVVYQLKPVYFPTTAHMHKHKQNIEHARRYPLTQDLNSENILAVLLVCWSNADCVDL